MNQQQIQRRIGIVLLSMAIASLCFVLLDRLVFKHQTAWATATDLSVVVLAVSVLVFGTLAFWDHPIARRTMAFTVFLISLPSILGGTTNYWWIGIMIIGILLFHRFGMLAKHFRLKATSILLWTVCLVFSVDRLNPQISIVSSVSTVLFVFTNLVLLYILFEEEIRDLLASNKAKDATLAAQAAEIARLEPMGVLGQRVAHVAHSFKNNLNQVSTALFYLEQAHEPEKAAAKLRDFSRGMDQRIENILMVSRAGSQKTSELFDAARTLEGMQDIYMRERAFVDRARATVSIEGPVLVDGVQWDFILMIENILRNAVEACQERGEYGSVTVTLRAGVLAVANDGGAMALCADCGADCLACPQYGRPGQTTKKTGSGHGLAQVFTACRTYGWPLKIRTHGDWTCFLIALKPGITLTEVLWEPAVEEPGKADSST